MMSSSRPTARPRPAYGANAFAPEPLEGRVLMSLPPGFAQSTFASGANSPTSMTFAPDGRLFVTEQAGAVKVFSASGAPLGTFATVPARNVDEQGLLGVAFDPDYATNGYVYIHWITSSRNNRVTRYTAGTSNPNVGEAPRVVIDLPVNFGGNHQGGAVHFGPDGKLYLAVGDHGDSSLAQSLSNPFGKVLRFNPDGTIPQDNPFVASTTGINQAIWARGLRNPFTMAFQPGTGKLFVNDVGSNLYEEINQGAAGANYGWPTTEGMFDAARYPGFTNPVYAYRRGDVGCAIIGGAFYDPADNAPSTFPAEYRGKYFFSDYCQGFIRVLDPATGGASVFATAGQLPDETVDIDLGPDGRIYTLSRATGGVTAISFTGTNAPSITTHPRSQTVTQGRPVTFNVVASGAGVLSYQWQRDGQDIPGAISSSYRIDAVSAGDNGARFRVLVSNGAGTTTSQEATLTVTANNAPVATITAPAAGGLYAAGDRITFAGTATDAEDGALPGPNFTWRVDFHHATHHHPFIAPFTGVTGGEFTVPTAGETAADVWYRIHLTVTDSQGLTHSTFTDVQPRLAEMTFATSPSGLSLEVDGMPVNTPHAVSGVVGVVRAITAPATQNVGGVDYEFVGWSDGGARSHTISTPDAATTYTAVYRPATTVAGRHVFYNNSLFDGRRAAADAGDDDAVATDKQALLPGGTATFSNYTSYVNGINGVMIDLRNGGMPVTAENFTFRVGNGNDPSTWTPAPAPATVARRDGAGVGGSDRVSITWPDRAIRGKWLQVSFSAAPGEAPRDMFYFGNAVGETGNSAANAYVNAVDIGGTRARRTATATITNRWDFNRDRRVNVLDLQLVRRSYAVGAGALVLVAPPAPAASPESATASVASVAPERPSYAPKRTATSLLYPTTEADPEP